MKRKWILGPILVGMLALGIIGAGSVLAQTVEPEQEQESVVSSFAARVAAILGLDEAVVEGAMEQAHREMHDERVQAYLESLVANGRITQEEADAYLEWYQARPEGAPFGPAFGPGRGGHKGFHGGPGPRPQAEPTVTITPEATGTAA